MQQVSSLSIAPSVCWLLADPLLIIRVDLWLTLYSGSRSLFIPEDISWKTYLTPTRQSLELVNLSSLLPIDWRLANVWSDLQILCSRINVAFLEDRKLDPNLFEELTISVPHRLLQLDYSGTS